MTREEAKEVFLNRGFIDGVYDGDKWREACIVISKWLEQEPTIDKIRAEILEISSYEGFELGGVKDGYRIAIVNVLNILDKYKAESEPQESEDNNG